MQIPKRNKNMIRQSKIKFMNLDMPQQVPIGWELSSAIWTKENTKLAIATINNHYQRLQFTVSWSKCQLWSSGLWCYIQLKTAETCCSKMLVTTKTTRRHNPENRDTFTDGRTPNIKPSSTFSVLLTAP
jgi:hypothetical protein